MSESLGWSPQKLASLAQEILAGGSTALMVVQGGRVVFRWGEVALKSSVASVRKSLINVLYGIHVAEEKIHLDATLAERGIDDDEPLTPVEKQATVRDLLRARSGVYLPSVYNTDRGRPARGSHRPGTHWFYNNWDFNVLGAILDRQTSEDPFEAFAPRPSDGLSSTARKPALVGPPCLV